ncbi:MAG: hypothetical protein E7481_07060 [Ruminococcaceae bacterium]|nr:hypothetical protein [Oscillospiraceae bacterium]
MTTINSLIFKKSIVYTIILATLLSFSLTSFAALPGNSEISPLWVNLSAMDLDFYFSGNTGTASGEIYRKLSATLIEATLTVYRKEGFRWVTVASQTDSSNISLAINVEFNAIAGATYKAVLDVMVYGTSVDETETITETVTYQ